MRHLRARRMNAWVRARRRAYHQGSALYSKGRGNEAKVGRALKVLKEEGYIESYFVSIPNDTLDRKGIDAGLTTVQGAEVVFQIKSSDRGVQKHMRRHPEIPCLNVHDCLDALDIFRLIRIQFKLSREHCA